MSPSAVGSTGFKLLDTVLTQNLAKPVIKSIDRYSAIIRCGAISNQAL